MVQNWSQLKIPNAQIRQNSVGGMVISHKRGSLIESHFFTDGFFLISLRKVFDANDANIANFV